MLNIVNAFPAAQLNAAKISLDNKQHDLAKAQLAEILRREPGNHIALSMMSEVFAGQVRWMEAIRFCMMAIRANPSEISYKENLIQWGGDHPVSGYDELAEYALLECLKSADRVDCSRLSVLWTSHIMVTPAFFAAYGPALAGMLPFDSRNRTIYEAKITDLRPLLMPCFLLGIKNIILCNPLFEEFITHVRRQLLVGAKYLTMQETMTLAEALSHYAFGTDYILDCTDGEQGKVDALRASIESGHADTVSILLFACYAPLCTLKNKDSLVAPEADGVIKAQIRDYEALRQTAESVVAITSIDDTVSKAVREQYETFPYPRFLSFAKESTLHGWRLTRSKVEGHLRGRKTKALIAGCGTGREAMAYGSIFHDAEILAVDLSRNSLAYGINKAKEQDVDNVTFRQADILHLDVLGMNFDFISCGGVLHHMQDPLKGWKILRNLLKSDGLMSIGLYSKMARWAINQGRAAAAKGHFASDYQGMKVFRRKSPQILEKNVLAELGKLADYYNMNTYRDLLFHVQEHNYNLLEIRDMLRELDLEFVSFWSPPALDAYARAHPEDPLKTNLENWHRLEEKNPQMFSEMYTFWCRKRDPA